LSEFSFAPQNSGFPPGINKPVGCCHEVPSTLTASRFSHLSPSTIAAPCAGRTVSAVIAIRAYALGEDPGGKGSRQVQRGFKAAANRFSQGHGVRGRGGRGESGASIPAGCSPQRRRGFTSSSLRER